MRYFLLAILLVGSLTNSQANDLATDFDAAIKQQNAGQYTEAITGYEAILATGTVSSELYNNLGLAYYQSKQLGKAIANFHRALRQESSNEDAKHNLAAAQQQIEETTVQIEDIFIVRAWNGLAGSLSANGWGIVFLLTLCLGAGGLSLWKIGGSSQLKRKGFWAAMVIFAFSLLPLIWGLQQRSWELDSKTAIITKEKVGMREAPNLGSEEIELVYEGNAVELLDDENGWTKIRLSNGLIGWVPAQMIEKV
ncbi:MAG: SH3 domain-containing protein [Aureispira sp.]|nr:SH3 domain-containing protein [Aureispira sp.]